MTTTLAFLVQTLLIVALPHVILRLGRADAFVPLVVVQLLVGIALGPSVLGRIVPETYHLLFNATTLTPLSGIASMAVLFFGLITGLHLDPATFRGRGPAFSLVAAASIAAPASLGALAGWWIAARYPAELGQGIRPVELAMAIGVSTGVTALPVLGAILREMDLLGTWIGQMALGLAAVNDAALWILLAFLLATVSGQGPQGPGPLGMLLVAPIYLLAMTRVAPLLLRRVTAGLPGEASLSGNALVVVCAVTIGSAVVTELIGLHYVLGAFVAGAVVPHELQKPILDRLQDMTVGVLMPFFFMLTGLRTMIEPGSFSFLEIFLVATAVAVAGKMGGTALAARLVGEPWPVSLCLGALVQTKGLMEVIVLTVLLDAGIITTNMFSALILMAVVSTALAVPLARLMLPHTSGERRLGGRWRAMAAAIETSRREPRG
jgi:Kef-type K+ transport system membrane component KefB